MLVRCYLSVDANSHCNKINMCFLTPSSHLLQVSHDDYDDVDDDDDVVVGDDDDDDVDEGIEELMTMIILIIISTRQQ